ncbi:MAG: hypothetical protein GY821_12505, partial [Gammaproteobacteria bacterium]|nr:hypothetical protein [Gammaproteobacteria bacterium]
NQTHDLPTQKKQDFFWRTAGSGGKATVTRRGETSFVGDITFLPAPNALKIWIDTKNVKKVSLNSVFLPNKFLPLKWYNEEIRKRNQLGIKKPVVIIFKLYKKKENYIFCRYCDFNLDISLFFKNYVILNNNKHLSGKFIVLCLDDFLKMADKKKIIEIER